MPNGRQQKHVTKMDSTNHVLGIGWEDGGAGGKLDNISNSSGTFFAGFQLEKPTLQTNVSASILFSLNSSKVYGPCLVLCNRI